MATAVSAYFQPCRAHVAQPARCLDVQYSYSYSELPGAGAAPPSRRRQPARCAEWRDVREPRDTPAAGSVRRTREQLARAARAQAARAAPAVDVEPAAVCSKVEEVRRKFEGGACVTFSRSFESPPRRRLADSLFASFKLPRRRSDAMTSSQPRSLGVAAGGKRKSAVELLAETKAFYVKSETVLDRKQELPLRVSSGLGQAIAAGGCKPVSSTAVNSAACCQPHVGCGVARAPFLPGGARRTVSAGEGLQSTLRRLLDYSDSRENVHWQPIYAVPHKPLEARRSREAGACSGTSSSGSGSRHRRSEPDCDARLYIADPQLPRPHHYSITSSFSSSEDVELPEPPPPRPADLSPPELGAISPPAQYAHSTHSPYVRSNSQSAATARRCSTDENDCTNINSHKSLPDLHTHARCYDNVSASGGDTPGRSPRRRRHSAHQRTASNSSRGTRSNHSSLVSSCEAFSEHPSPGEDYSYNRCGSSFARDSGGSSGHYTQRSAPPHAQPRAPHARAHRTDSGSSGQHSHNRSYYADVGYGDEEAPAKWAVVSAPLQFQDGAPSPPPPPCTHYPNTLVGIHFQASAPPPQFQDESPDAESGGGGGGGGGEPRRHGRSLPQCRSGARAAHGYVRERDYSSRGPEPEGRGTEDRAASKPARVEPRATRPAVDDSGDYVNTTQVHGEEVTSPLGTFKRQRCLRYKQRRPRPILRSKSDISDSRYRRSEPRAQAQDDDDSPASPEETSVRLHRFFHTLGLEQRAFDTLLASASPTGKTDSPVFFSDVSTVDSNQLALNADYTVHGPPAPAAAYRNTDPPSVVERNARIIKWLCNCRKLQPTQ